MLISQFVTGGCECAHKHVRHVQGKSDDKCLRHRRGKGTCGKGGCEDNGGCVGARAVCGRTDVRTLCGFVGTRTQRAPCGCGASCGRAGVRTLCGFVGARTPRKCRVGARCREGCAGEVTLAVFASFPFVFSISCFFCN